MDTLKYVVALVQALVGSQLTGYRAAHVSNGALTISPLVGCEATVENMALKINTHTN